MSDYNPGYMPDNITNDPGFSDEIEEKRIIKVIGVGGGGNNAINHMYKQNIKGVSFVVCNTDRQALIASDVPTKILIGPNTTKGLGAGNKPEVAKEAAEESEAAIGELFDDETEMVFITAGMGGGTGTGAAPVVARIAKEHGVLTIGIVTIPFLFEGEKKIIKALNGAEEMGKYVDALLIINNERLTEIYSELDFVNAFGKADDTLTTAARSISELITCKGRINLDFNDVNTTLRNGGVAIISSGYGEGDRRVTKAIEDALNSPLLKNRDVYGSKRILVNIYFSEQAKTPFVMKEVDEMREFMCNFAPEVDVIWGVAFDNTLGEKVKITILASGFNVALGVENETKPRTSDMGQTALKEPAPDDNRNRLAGEYGLEKIMMHEQESAKARYVVRTLDEYDIDEVVDLIERTPTFGREPKFRDIVDSVINAYSAGTTATPTQIPQVNKSNQGTISFVE